MTLAVRVCAARPQTTASRDLPLTEKYPEFVYRTSTGAELSLSNSVGYLLTLCQAMAECQSFNLRPVMAIDEVISTDLVVERAYVCRLTMPAVLHVEPITSKPFPSKAVAKAVACYEACVKLHQTGFVDDDLNPTKHSTHLAQYDFFLEDVENYDDETNQRVPLKMECHLHLGLEPVMEGGGA
jgi:hypothetical protein